VGDEGSNDLDPLSRPLPSVGMPLLRGQVAARRARRIAGAVALGAAAIGGLIYLILSDDTAPEEPEEPSFASAPGDPQEPDVALDEPDAGDPEGTEAVAAEERPAPEPVDVDPVSPEATQRFEATFGNARGFRPAAVNAGVTEAECVDLEGALDGVLDFRRCRPEHRIVYERDAEGELVRFAYHDSATSYVEAVRDGEGAFTANRVEREVERTPIVRSGTVRTSLGDAMAAVGLGRQVVGVFVEVFDGKVNFSTQAREGDAFRIVIEEERLDGELLQYGRTLALEYVGQRAGHLRAFWYEPRGRRGNWYDETGREIRGGWLRVPCRYDRISSPYNPRRMHPILRRIHPHNGVDFAASTGTPVWAAADGRVTWAGPKGPNGNLVSIEHEGGYMTHYAHLHRIQRGIRRGVQVEQRQLIGAVGTTGRSTGPHLHFGLKRNGRFLDPMEVLNGPGRRLPSGQLGAFRRRMRELEEQLETVELDAPEVAEASPRAPDSDEGLD